MFIIYYLHIQGCKPATLNAFFDYLLLLLLYIQGCRRATLNAFLCFFRTCVAGGGVRTRVGGFCHVMTKPLDVRSTVLQALFYEYIQS